MDTANQWRALKHSNDSDIGARAKWNRCGVEWRGNDEQYQSNVVSDRGAFERIRFAMNLFKNHFLEQKVYDNDSPSRSSSSENTIFVDLFAECLSDYDAVSLLNDFECIRQHRAGTDELRDCKVSGPLNVCCGTLMRECREMEATDVHDMQQSPRSRRFNRYFESLDERQRLLIETTTKIHCFINHPIHRTENESNDDDEKGDGVNTWRRGRRREIANKFVNEMPTTYSTVRNDDGTFKTKMDDLPSVLIAHRNYSVSQPHPSRSSPDSFCKFVKTEDMDSDAIVEDLHESVYRTKLCRESIDEAKQPIASDSNLSPMLDSDSILVKKVVHHFNQLNVFTFGFPLRYWKRWKHFRGYIKSPKYRNLKEECLNNDIHSMSRFKFHCLLVNARTLWETNQCRRLKSDKFGVRRRMLMIPGHSPLSLSHLFVLLMYCNLTKLQTHYKRHGCRERAGEPFDIEDLMRRNSEIGWWCKLIFESVTMWGTSVTANDVFYTGLDKPMLFDSMVPTWHCPFSTSVSRKVALNFATTQGVILKMKGSSLPGSYMDCEWFSNYPEECERLFVISRGLRIVDIQTYDFENKFWASNRIPISALVLCSAVSSGHWLSKLLGRQTDEDSPDTMLLMMIREYNARENGHDQCLTNNSLYVEQMFRYLVERIRFTFTKPEPWRMIKSEYLLLSKELRNEFLQFDSGGYVRVSPFLRSLGCTVDKIHFMEEYMWILTGQELDRFKAMGERGVMKSKMYSYRKKNGLSIRFRMELQRSMDGSQHTRFVIRHSYNGVKGSSYNGMEEAWLQEVCAVSIDEVDWYRNAVTFHKTEMGNFCLLSFQDSLLMSVSRLTVRLAMEFNRTFKLLNPL